MAIDLLDFLKNFCLKIIMNVTNGQLSALNILRAFFGRFGKRVEFGGEQ
jgi:hypothetical protein